MRELIVVLEDDKSELCDKINTSDAWGRRRDLVPDEDLVHEAKLLVVDIINEAITKHLESPNPGQYDMANFGDENGNQSYFSGNLPVYRVMTTSMLMEYGNSTRKVKPLLELKSKLGIMQPFVPEDL